MRHGRRPDAERDRATTRSSVARSRPSSPALTVALRLPAYLASAAPHLRRRGVRRLGGRHARRRPALPRRLLQPGSAVPPARVGRPTSSASAPRTRPRLLSLAAALAARRAPPTSPAASITDRGGALLAAGLVSVTATSLWITGPLAADGAALAFATATMAMVLAVAGRRDRPAGDVDRPRHRRHHLGEGAPRAR